MAKIYLSKSTPQNFEVYSLVKKKLQDLGHEIVEFTGGQYTPQPMLACDYLFIVPPERIIGSPRQNNPQSYSYDRDSVRGTYDLGRGQAEQIRAWLFANDMVFEDHSPEDDEESEYYSIDEDNINKSNTIIILKEISIDAKGDTHLYCDNIEDLNLDKVNWQDEWGFPNPCGKDLAIESMLPETHLQNNQKDILVKTGSSQSVACSTCKFAGNCESGPHAPTRCPASGGQHYPKYSIERVKGVQITINKPILATCKYYNII